MKAHRRSTIPRRAAAISVAGGLLVAALGMWTPAAAEHGPEHPSGPYSGYSSGAAAHVDVLTSEDARLLDAEVGVAQAAVDSEGLQETLNVYDRPIVPSGIADKHSRGHSSLVELGVALQPPSAANQVAPFVAEANAPEDESVDESLLDQTVSPLIHASLLRRIAEAKWNDQTCILGEPISTGQQHLAWVQLLETGDTEAVEEGFELPVLGISASSAGPTRAATHVESRQQLFAGTGEGFGLQSVVTNTLAPVTLFEGTENELTIEVDGPAFLSASADGTSGGARTIFRAPVVTIIQAGEIVQMLPGEEIDIRVPPGTGDILAQIRVGVMDALPGSGLGENTEAADGTKAAAVANVVEIKLLDVADPALRGATIALGHMEAVSEVPAGGIDCPIPVTKTPSSQQVEVNDIFETTISVTNPFNCTIANLRIEDEITTEQNARFEVVDISDGGTGPSGSSLASGTVTWANLGSLGPGETRSVELSLQAQDGAGVIADTATASGTLVDCEVGFAPGSADVSALASSDVDVDGDASLEVPATAVLGGRQLPTTGFAPLASALGGGALIAMAGALAVRLRRPLV